MAPDTSLRLEFKSGERIFAEGDPADYCYQVFRGKVDIVLSSGGKHEVIASIGPGEVFGEMGIIDSGPRSATAIAVEDTVCVAYSASNILDQLEKNPSTTIEIMKTLIRRLRNSNRRFSSLEADRVEMSDSRPGPPRETDADGDLWTAILGRIASTFQRQSKVK